jgi:chromosome segregation ATPase
MMRLARCAKGPEVVVEEPEEEEQQTDDALREELARLDRRQRRTRARTEGVHGRWAQLGPVRERLQAQQSELRQELGRMLLLQAPDGSSSSSCEEEDAEVKALRERVRRCTEETEAYTASEARVTVEYNALIAEQEASARGYRALTAQLGRSMARGQAQLRRDKVARRRSAAAVAQREREFARVVLLVATQTGALHLR